MDKRKIMKTIAIQGDELNSLNLKGDSSLYISSMMQLRGYKIFWYEPHNLYYSNGTISAIGHYISVLFDKNKSLLQYTILKNNFELNLASVNCIMIRQNPPVNMHYITSSHILSILSFINPKILFINHPDVVINYGEKFLPLIVCPEHIPYTLISSNVNHIDSFLKLHKKCVIKPIYGYGGNDVALIENGQVDIINSALQKAENIQLIIQEFLPEIYYGDKRIIVCDGIILGALKREPAVGNFLTNTIAGGIVKPTSLSNDEELLCIKIAKALDNLRIFLAGIDMIGNYVTEINITSPGLLTAMDKIYGSHIMDNFFNIIDKKSTT